MKQLRKKLFLVYFSKVEKARTNEKMDLIFKHTDGTRKTEGQKDVVTLTW